MRTLLCSKALTLLVLVFSFFSQTAQALQDSSRDIPTSISIRAAALSTKGSVNVYKYKVLNAIPHSTRAFTQGLVIDEGILYESTGLYGRSAITKKDMGLNKVLGRINLPERYFGEGITLVNDKIVQLTWRSGTGFVYNKNSFEKLGSFQYPTEGWGITYDGNRLIMSDGSQKLFFLDPDTFEITGEVEVVDDNGPVFRLNELEFIKGSIYANVWKTDRIVVVNPHSGKVAGLLDLSKLTRRAGGDRKVKTLNGIAYDRIRDSIYVTGKLWPWIYEIKVLFHDQSPLIRSP